MSTEMKVQANDEKLVITEIKETPFRHTTNGTKNYLICGKVLLETEKTKEECETWLQEKPWEAIALLCQAITNEMSNTKK